MKRRFDLIHSKSSEFGCSDILVENLIPYCGCFVDTLNGMHQCHFMPSEKEHDMKKTVNSTEFTQKTTLNTSRNIVWKSLKQITDIYENISKHKSTLVIERI